ncbi:MAG: hypothetical protein H6R17_3048 [Proteobacteria bacterium]|nr:hypothetical protein [Pseudomonadota bacterium]
MWLRIKAFVQCAWASKSKSEQREISIKAVLALATGLVSLLTMAASIDLASLWEVLCKVYLPKAVAALAEHWPRLLVSFVTACASAFFLYRQLSSMLGRNLLWLEKPVRAPGMPGLPQDYLDAGYQIVEAGPAEQYGRAVVSLAVNRAIRCAAELPLNVREGLWKLRGLGEELLPFALYRASRRGLVFDADKLRLGSDLLLNKGKLPKRVEIQKTRYFSGLATNDVSYLEVNSRPVSDLYSPLKSIYDGFSLFLTQIGERLTLAQLAGSRCSNHLGVSTMAVTRDGVVLITGQSSHNIQSRRLLAPSGSGSVDWRDLGQSNDLLAVVRRAAERELTEECGFKAGRYPMKTSVIGFARLVHRGGKPEFFCLTEIDENAGDLELAHGHDEKLFTAFNHSDQMYREIDLDPLNIEESVRAFCAAHRNDNSVLLELALQFMADEIVDRQSIAVFRR